MEPANPGDLSPDGQTTSPSQSHDSSPSPTFQNDGQGAQKRLPQKPGMMGRLVRLFSRLLIAGIVIAGVVFAGKKIWDEVRPEADVEVTTLTYTVVPRDLKVTVTESGNLESQKTVKGTCELNSYENKIISIVDEGTLVKEGEVVVTLSLIHI